MDAVAEKRQRMLQGLIKTLPPASLRSLEMALGLTHEQKMVAVRELISAEIEFRHVRAAVFEPFMPLFQVRPDGLTGVMFDSRIVNGLWAALEACEPELQAEARQALRGLRTDDPTPQAFFRLVAVAAELCRSAPQTLLSPGVDSMAKVAEFARYLDLHRLARQVLAKQYDFMGRMDADKASALRLLFRDACALDPASGARFLEIIYANLDDGAQIIKFVATVSERPNDRFLAVSELAGFGTRILDPIEAQLADLKTFMGASTGDDSDAAADRLAKALGQLQAFGHYIELARDGPWGLRVAEAHRLIAELAERQLLAAEKALDAALPIASERNGPRLRKDVPDIARQVPDEVVVAAQRRLSFIRKVRNIAVAGGFAALHTKVTQALETKLDACFADLLELANSETPFDAEVLMAAFERVTDLMEALCGEDKAIMARRRIASSDILNPVNLRQAKA